MKKIEKEIDYLHPNGKPKVSKKHETFEHQLEDDTKSERNALAEADGHHVCSDECRRSHDLADKSEDEGRLDS